MPPTRRGRCRPATPPRPSRLLLAEDGVHHPAATYMRARLTQMDEDLLVSAAGVFQCVGQHGEAVGVARAGREDAFVVGGLSQIGHGRSSPGGVEGHGPEGVADDVTEQASLLPPFPTPEVRTGGVRRKTR